MSSGSNDIHSYTWDDEMIGSGGSANVYKGEHKETGKIVAVKVLHLLPSEEEMKEVHLLQTCSHNNIIKVFAAGFIAGKYTIVMEYCSEGSLAKILKLPKHALGLDEDDFVLLLEFMCNIIGYLRGKNIIHRDIKPQNICLHYSSNNNKVFKLIDFGLARKFSSQEKWTADDYIGGTPLYWHPKVNNEYIYETGTVSVSSKDYIDLWSIGVTLYEAATGRRPFQPRRSNGLLFKKLNEAFAEKQSGVIAMQEEENGSWTQYRTLPEEINLSITMACFITPMLAGLMEVDRQLMWTVDRFVDYCGALIKVNSTKKANRLLCEELNQARLEVQDLHTRVRQVQGEREFSRDLNQLYQLDPIGALTEASLTLTLIGKKKRTSESQESPLPSPVFSSLFVQPYGVPDNLKNYQCQGLSVITCSSNGAYPIIDWTKLRGNRNWKTSWLRINQRVNSQAALWFPPMLLPLELGGILIQLLIQWRNQLVVCGHIVTDHFPNDFHPPPSVRFAFQLEVSIKGPERFHFQENCVLNVCQYGGDYSELVRITDKALMKCFLPVVKIQLLQIH